MHPRLAFRPGRSGLNRRSQNLAVTIQYRPGDSKVKELFSGDGSPRAVPNRPNQGGNPKMPSVPYRQLQESPGVFPWDFPGPPRERRDGEEPFERASDSVHSLSHTRRVQGYGADGSEDPYLRVGRPDPLEGAFQSCPSRAEIPLKDPCVAYDTGVFHVFTSGASYRTPEFRTYAGSFPGYGSPDVTRTADGRFILAYQTRDTANPGRIHTWPLSRRRTSTGGSRIDSRRASKPGPRRGSFTPPRLLNATSTASWPATITAAATIWASRPASRSSSSARRAPGTLRTGSSRTKPADSGKTVANARSFLCRAPDLGAPVGQAAGRS